MFLKVVYLTTIFAVVLADFPSLTCHKGGHDRIHECAHFVNDFCHEVTKHHLRAGDSVGRCYKLHHGNKCDFTAFNSGKFDSAPHFGDCQTTLDEVLKKCKTVGHGDFGHDTFTFAVDSSFGHCAPKI